MAAGEAVFQSVSEVGRILIVCKVSHLDVGGDLSLTFFTLRTNSGSLAMFAAILRASSVEKVNSHTSHIAGNSHTDSNRHCNIDKETPRDRDEHNPNSRRNKIPAKVPQLCSDLGDGDGGRCALLPLAQTERLYLRALHSHAA
jgi:hypothetical protein